MSGNFQKSRTVDRRVRFGRQAAIDVTDDKVILSCGLKRHDQELSMEIACDSKEKRNVRMIL